MVKFGILGTGIVGLNTAVAIQEQYPTCEIVILADKDFQNISSYGAAGIFRPDPSLLSGLKCCNSTETCKNCPFIRWCSKSWENFSQICLSQLSIYSGVFFHPTFTLSEDVTSKTPFLTQFCAYSRKVERDELFHLGFNANIRSGIFYTTVIIEGRDHMPFLLHKLHQGSVKYSSTIGPSAHIRSKESLVNVATKEKLDVIVNCTGLGSAILWEDNKIFPTRGQLVRVFAPWMKYGFYGPNDTYAYTGKDSVILGGFRENFPSPITRPIKDEDLLVDANKTSDILKRVQKTWNGPLHCAPVVEEWVGFRPTRPLPRIELEWLDGPKQIPVIHNYGHGAMGVALSWGTALDAVYLVEQSLKISGNSSKQTLMAPGLESV